MRPPAMRDKLRGNILFQNIMLGFQPENLFRSQNPKASPWASVVLSLFWRLFAMRQTVKETVGRYPVQPL